MLVHRNPAAVVRNGYPIAFFHTEFNPRGMTSDGFVHRIVEHFGNKVVQRAIVGPADIHPRAAAHGLEPLENLDRGGIVIAAGGGRVFEQIVGHGRSYIVRSPSVTSAPDGLSAPLRTVPARSR